MGGRYRSEGEEKDVISQRRCKGGWFDSVGHEGNYGVEVEDNNSFAGILGIRARQRTDHRMKRTPCSVILKNKGEVSYCPPSYRRD